MVLVVFGPQVRVGDGQAQAGDSLEEARPCDLEFHAGQALAPQVLVGVDVLDGLAKRVRRRAG